MRTIPEPVLRRVVKPALLLVFLWPFAGLVWGVLHNDLGANPVETVEHVTGDWTLRLLLLTLAMTPLRLLTGQPWPIRLRRMLGLLSFFYACLHFLTWLGLDEQGQWSEIVADVAKRPYVTVGFLAWLILLPLAVTSNRWSIRRLGKNWSRLHKAVYLAAPLGVLHYLWLVKADWLDPMLYGVVLAVLLAFRLPVIRQKARHFVAGGSVAG